MNIFRSIILALSFLTLVNCGSGKRIITDDGKVYEVKGSTIKKDGVDVTKNLSKEEKKSIDNLIKEKEEARKIFEAKQKDIEDAISEQKSIQKEARKNQRKLERDLKDLENSLKATQNARDKYATTRSRYTKSKNEFKQLKKDGELSPNAIDDWKERLSKLKMEVKKAKKELNKKR